MMRFEPVVGIIVGERKEPPSRKAVMAGFPSEVARCRVVVAYNRGCTKSTVVKNNLGSLDDDNIDVAARWFLRAVT